MIWAVLVIIAVVILGLNALLEFCEVHLEGSLKLKRRRGDITSHIRGTLTAVLGGIIGISGLLIGLGVLKP